MQCYNNMAILCSYVMIGSSLCSRFLCGVAIRHTPGSTSGCLISSDTDSIWCNDLCAACEMLQVSLLESGIKEEV